MAKPTHPNTHCTTARSYVATLANGRRIGFSAPADNAETEARTIARLNGVDLVAGPAAVRSYL